MITRSKIGILILLICSVPLIVHSNPIDPDDNCPKKKKLKEDTVQVSEEASTQDEASLKISSITPNTFIISDKEQQSGIATNEQEDSEMDSIDGEDPSSALSFNFIYYIIEKFKFTAVEE